MNSCSHDPGAALIKIDGKNFDYIFAEEGFLSRRKKSYQFPIRAIEYCLSYFNIKIDDIDKFIFDYMDKKHPFRTSDNYRLLAGDFIRSKLKINPEKISFVETHHLAHAYTAFYPSGFNKAAVVIIDGLGSENQTHSIYSANRETGIKLLYEQKGTGIGTLYTTITKILGFESGEEGKTMGLAPYGKDCIKQDAAIPSFEGVYNGFSTDYSRQMRRSPDRALRIQLKQCTNKKDIYEPYFTRMAYNLQKETEKCLVHLVKEAVKITGISNVCLAGGVALNCVANGIIQNLECVEKLYVYPASGDTGLPIGLALYGAEQKTKDWINIISNRAVIEKLSKPFSQDVTPLQIETLPSYEKIIKDHKVRANDYSAEVIAQNIAKGKIVCFFQDGIELGPRALGHRSFLADPRSSEMKKTMNAKIKHRESYRPFAPMILKEFFNQYFVHETDDHPYMLQAPICHKRAKDEAPAVVHVDNTARVQTITKKNGRVFDVLTEFYRITGTPLVINTSFNDNNEPIVFTCIDALCCFGRTNADILVVNNKWYERKDILNISAFIYDCEEAQKKIKNKFFERSIKNNTTISKSTSGQSLINFIRYNLRLTSVNRAERLHLKLLNFIYSREVERTLFLDQYHFDFLNSIFHMLSGSFKKQIPVFKIVNDDIDAMTVITDGSDVLLYNASLFDHRKQDLNIFYDSEDLRLEPLNNKESTNKNNKAIRMLVESYENNNSKNIEDFFEDITN